MSRHGLTRVGRALVTTFGLGLLRPAPGTWGSLPPTVMSGLMYWLGMPTWLHAGVLCVVLGVFSGACVRYGDEAEAYFNKKDHGSVCADETAGVCLPLIALAVGGGQGWWWWGVVLAFVGFRAADIVKAWPAWGLQRVPSGWGVLLDDLAAGVQAALVVVVVSVAV